jgi:hypothetical protein
MPTTTRTTTTTTTRTTTTTTTKQSLEPVELRSRLKSLKSHYRISNYAVGPTINTQQINYKKNRM